MDQLYPKGWPDLPESITYEKELSERFTTKSEPEYILRNEDDVKFLIREYEGGNREILTYDLVNHSTMRLEPNEPFFPVLEDLFTLLECEYLHEPPVNDIHYRGYDSETQMVWEYTSEPEFKERPPSAFTAPSFLKVELDDIPDKGRLLAKVKSTSNRRDLSLNSKGVDVDDLEITREFYENIAIHKQKGEIVETYPIPEIVLITNTINKITKNKASRIVEIKEPIKSNVLLKNI